MSLSGDSCSTSSGCVSDLETDTPLSEDRSPDSPISDSLSDSLISSTNSVTKSLPNTEEEDFDNKNVITNELTLLSINWKAAQDLDQEVDEGVIEEELIESEIVIDSSQVVDFVDTAEDEDHSLAKDVKDFKCMSDTRIRFDAHKSDGTASDCSKTSSKSRNSTTSDTNSDAVDGVPHYCCKWTHCDWPGSKDDLVDHIREIHVELQPYQQQKHVWVDSQTNRTKANSKSQTRRLADSASNTVSAAASGSSSAKKTESIGHQKQQQYVCLWEGCKVYGKGSSSRNWLERHVLEQHSGPRPFKCIVEGCGQRFKLQSALERHVNSHFKPSVDCYSNCSSDVTNMCPNGSNSCLANDSSNSAQNSVHGLSPFELHLRQSSSSLHMRATMSARASVDSSSAHHMCTNGPNGTPNKILKRKKSNQKIRRKYFYVKCSEDFFDECVMEQIRYGLIQLNTRTGLDLSGSQSTITFHSEVIARRESDSGEVNVLLKWEPNDILPDVWVPEDKVSELRSKTVPVSTIPPNCLAQLFERKPMTKQRRK